MIIENKTPQEKIWMCFRYFLLTFGAFVALLPLVTVLFASFKGNQEYAMTSALAIPKSWSYFGNFAVAFTKGKMALAFRNTLIILFFTLLGSVLSGTMIGYVLSRFTFKGKNFLKYLFLVANLIPGVTMQISCYKIMTVLHLVNSLPGIIILYTGTDIIAIYIFLQYFNSLPISLDEAAFLDGANYFTIFFRILLPLVKPAITTVCILKGVSTYKEFYMANLYLQTRSKYVTISTCLYAFIDEYGNQYNYICAGIIITLIPILVLFLFSQRYIYNGITQGAIKE